jgi:O-antigen/teichoic acid export membrane protein
VGSAIAFFLYQPMFNKDTLTINEIVTLQGWIYRRVAFVIMAAAAILMCFFPIIFKGITLPLWYAYATFLVMLFGSLLGYFVNYRLCVLAADQKFYKVTRVTAGASLFFRIVLIIILPYVPSPFLFYIGTNLLGTVFGSIWLNHVLKKEYPWLRHAELTGKQLLKKYPGILKKTSQLFFHQITTYIVFRLGPLVMYAFTSLTAIAYYGNYVAIIDKARDVLNMAFNSTQAAVGNLIASHNKQHSLDVYWEMLDSRMAISTGALLVLGLITEPFISVWLSSKYLLGHTVLFIITFNSWLMINRITTDHFIDGYGIFQDIWAPIVEAVINLSSAILLGHYFGIAGVLSGNTISTLIIIYVWKPYFLFTRGFKLKPWKDFFRPILSRYALVGINILFFAWLNNILCPKHIQGFGSILIYGIILCVVIMPIVYGEFYIATPGTRRFNKRMVELIKSKI